MSGLEEISVRRQEGGRNKTGNWTGEDLTRRRSRRKRNRGGSSDLAEVNENVAPIQGFAGEPEGGEPGLRPVYGYKQVEENHRTKFYEHYRKEAEEYDKEFLKNRGEDLNTTLIFAGLFSAVTSAFIIQVQSGLQSDPNEETAALLRVLIYKIDNTTFGGDVPTLPQWTGPPQTIIHVQSLLYASLLTSLLSAFIAMLGKQWLNRYESVDIRGSAIERSQNRQRKLDGIVAWYFDYVMESLPLMLQAALLLLGCALSKYLWEVDTTVASVVLGLTSFGVFFYLFVVVAGASTASCPYQTPVANFIRFVSNRLAPSISRVSRLVHHFLRTLIRLRLSNSLSSYALFFKKSAVCRVSIEWWSVPSKSVVTILAKIILYLPVLLISFFIDALRFGRLVAVMLNKVIVYCPWLLVKIFTATLRLGIKIFISSAAQIPKPPTLFHVPGQAFDNQETELDFRCSLWMLQTTLDKTIMVSTLSFLRTIIPLAGLHSSISSAAVAQCFDVFRSCLVITDSGVATVTRGSEQLAGISATCFLRAFCLMLSTEPTSVVVGEVWKRYERVFTINVDLSGLPCPIAMDVIHHLFTGRWFRMDICWTSYTLSIDELITVSRVLAQAAQSRLCIRADLGHFALHFLSQDPLPPNSVIVDCLTIVATEMGYDVSDIIRRTSDESAQLEELFITVIMGCETTVFKKEYMTESTTGAVIAFVTYAARRKGSVAALPASLKYATLYAFSYGRFPEHASDTGAILRLWIAAASSLPYINDVGAEVVYALLKMASKDNIRSHIPVIAWNWLKKRPLLCSRPERGFGWSWNVIAQTVRSFRDIELTVSLLSIWSEQNGLHSPMWEETRCLIREEFSENLAAGYRADLIQLLDEILSRFEGEGHIQQHYEGLRSEVDKQAVKILNRFHSTFMCALPLP